MKSVNYYFNQEEKELFNNFEEQINSIKNRYNNFKNNLDNNDLDNTLRHKKYLGNLLRQINYIKDDIEGLKLERISEQIFYKNHFINEQNIQILNKDLLQIIRKYDFGGCDYLFVKEKNELEYKITTNIEQTLTLLKKDKISKIYKGRYNTKMYIEEMIKKSELIFDKKIMSFKKTNLCDIRTSSGPIYDLRITLSNQYVETHLIHDISDYDVIEANILQKNLKIISVSVASIDDINGNFVNVSHCFSIENKQSYNQSNTCSINNNLYTELYERIKQFINKDKN